MTLRYASMLLLITAVLVVAACGGPADEQPRVQAYVGARLIEGTGAAPVDDAVLLVREGRVAAAGPASAVPVPSGATRVDLRGRTIIPGLVNAHGHVAGTQGLQSGRQFYTEENIIRQLELYARYGVTTVFSLGDDGPEGFGIRSAQAATGPGSRARLFVAGPVVTGPTPDDARAQVDEVAGIGADIVKIRIDDNLGAGRKMAPATYRAVIERAHERGLRVAAHIYYLDDAKALLDARVDFIGHSVRDRPVDAALIERLTARAICYCPTLTREISTYIYEETPAFFDDPFFLRHADAATVDQLRDPERQQQYATSRAGQAYKAALPTAMANLKTLADAGVRIAMGTDSGPPARFQGYFEHLELEMMVDAGLTPMQAIVSATGDAARCMQVGEDLGTLQAGRRADFLVLTADPLADIRNTKTLESVWIAGEQVAE